MNRVEFRCFEVDKKKIIASKRWDMYCIHIYVSYTRRVQMNYVPM